MELTKQKRYWLRFGIALVFAYVVIGAISFVLLMNCTDGFNCLKYSIPLIIATGPVFERINDFLPSGVILLINAIIWFLIGSFIGWVYGKMKKV